MRRQVEQLPLFVYGTLRPGQVNFARHLQDKTTRIAAATFAGRLYHHEQEGYPYLLPGGGTVIGEVIEIKPEHWAETIRELDWVEDYFPDNESAGWYLRRQVKARLADGTTVRAWAYFWNRQDRPGSLIESGDWLQR